jgi:transposase
VKGWAADRRAWLLFDEDESWFSRFAQPRTHAWALPGQPLRLVQRERRKDDPQAKALAVFGAVRQDTEQVYLSFCDGQPNSEQTLGFVAALLDVARQEHKQVMVIIWDQASWHLSQRVRAWIHAHNQHAKRTGDVRLLVVRLPKRSPWLNPMEPRWVHAKRHLCEPDGELTAAEVQRRLSAHFHTSSWCSSFKL